MNRHLIFTVIILLVSISSAPAVEVTLSPRLTLSSEYTDNFFQTPDDTQDEYTTSAAPGATLDFRWNTAGLTLSYDPTYVTYAETDTESDWRHYGSMSGYWDFSRRTRLDVSNTVTVSEDPRDEEDVLSVTQGRNRYSRYYGDAAVTHQFGREDTVALGYAYAVLENEADFLEDNQESRPYFDLTKWFGDSRYGLETHLDYTLGEYEFSDDFNSIYGHLRLMRRLSRRLDAFVQYAHTITDYDGPTEDFTVYNPSVGFSYLIENATTVNLAVGYLIRDREQSEDESGISFTGDLVTSWSIPRGTVDLAAASGYRTSAFDSENLGFYYYANLNCSVSYGLTRNLTADAFGTYRYYLYTDTDPEITDNTVDLGAGLSYQALPWMVWRLEYSHRTVDSTENVREYDENRVLLSVTFAPVNPYRLN